MAYSRVTRRQKQLQAEAKFLLPPEELARVFSFMDLSNPVCSAAVVCKIWRAASNPLAWTTAIYELDPLAVLGPAGVKAAAQALHPQGWLKLAARLGTRACAHTTTCQQLGMYFHRGRAHRLCLTHRGLNPDHVPFMLNDFMYDKLPSAEVRTHTALQELYAPHALVLAYASMVTSRCLMTTHCCYAAGGSLAQHASQGSHHRHASHR
jgi:F-box-like